MAEAKESLTNHAITKNDLHLRLAFIIFGYHLSLTDRLEWFKVPQTIIFYQNVTNFINCLKKIIGLFCSF